MIAAIHAHMSTERDVSDANHHWQHSWLGVSRLIAVILGVRWFGDVWLEAKKALRWALAERERLRRSPWFN